MHEKATSPQASHDYIEVRSPGRINLIGEHTDYNGGFVLPAAIDKQIIVKIATNGSEDSCSLEAKNLSENFDFSLSRIEPQSQSWANYALGMIHEFQKLRLSMRGFDASIEGNVPIGGGMSSSAAFECRFGFALNAIFKLGLERMDIIQAAQRAENDFVGTQCGVMDIFTSGMGKADHVIMLDCRSLDYSYFPLQLGDYELLLLNTNVSHSLADTAYNTRRQECETGAGLFQKKYPKVNQLRDVDAAMLESFYDTLPDPINRRCRHVVTENLRVQEATKVLAQGNLQRMGELMYASHNSLRDDYEVSCPELDFLVHETVHRPEVLGSRMMGGGFGGCTLSLIHSPAREQFVEEIAKRYKESFNLELTPYHVKLADGTGFMPA